MKKLLFDHEKKQYIRYTTKKFKLFVSVHEFNSIEEIQHYIQENVGDITDNNIGACTSLGSKHYYLNAFDHDIYDSNLERAVKNIAYAMRRLADWYRYAYLIPVAQNRPPTFYSDDR